MLQAKHVFYPSTLTLKPKLKSNPTTLKKIQTLTRQRGAARSLSLSVCLSFSLYALFPCLLTPIYSVQLKQIFPRSPSLCSGTLSHCVCSLALFLFIGGGGGDGCFGRDLDAMYVMGATNVEKNKEQFISHKLNAYTLILHTSSELNESDTLKSSEDARTLGRFLFDQLVYMSRPSHPLEPTPAPFPAPTTGRIDGYFAKEVYALGVGGGGGRGGGSNSTLGGSSTKHSGGGNGSSHVRRGTSQSFLGNASLSKRPFSAGPRTGFGLGAGTGSGSGPGPGDRDRDLTPTAGGDGGKGLAADRASRKVNSGLSSATGHSTPDATNGGGGGTTVSSAGSNASNLSQSFLVSMGRTTMAAARTVAVRSKETRPHCWWGAFDSNHR